MRNSGVLASAVLLVGLAGCGGSGDDDGAGPVLDSTESVCDQFAGFLKNGGDRASVVDSIGGAVGNAAQGVQDAYGSLQNTVSADQSAQQVADDAFAQACFDAGWKS